MTKANVKLGDLPDEYFFKTTTSPTIVDIGGVKYTISGDVEAELVKKGIDPKTATVKQFNAAKKAVKKKKLKEFLAK